MVVHMKVAIAGKNGRLASHLQKIFEEKSHTVLLLASSSLVSQEFESQLRAYSPDLIVNTIAWTDVDGCQNNHLLSYELNVRLTEILCQFSATSATRFFQFSTDFVFDAHDNNPIHESKAVNPLQQYGIDKAIAEARVRSVMTGSSVLRTSSLYSAEDQCFFSNAMTALAQGEKYLAAVDVVSIPNSYESVALSVVELAESGFDEDIAHLVNLGSASRFELLKLGAQKLGISDSYLLPVPVSSLQLAAARPHFSVLRASTILTQSRENWEMDLSRAVRKVL